MQRLRNIDAERSEKGTPIEVLYKMYTSILDDSVNDAWDEHEKATYWNSTRRILCAITYNRGMLSKPALANLIQMDDIDSMLEDLHSIIRIPEDNNKQIGFLHISLHKFVTTMEHPSLYLTPQQSHSMLADTCLDLLNEACGQDSGKLQNGAEPKTQKVSPALQYACTKWVDHLCDGEESLPRNSKTFVFLKTHGKSWTKLLILSGQGFLVERLGDRLVEMIVSDTSSAEPKPPGYLANPG